MRKKRIYLTGFDNDRGIVYGCYGNMTIFSLRDALRDLKKFPCENGVLYKLVRIDPDTLKEVL